MLRSPTSSTCTARSVSSKPSYARADVATKRVVAHGVGMTTTVVYRTFIHICHVHKHSKHVCQIRDNNAFSGAIGECISYSWLTLSTHALHKRCYVQLKRRDRRFR